MSSGPNHGRGEPRCMTCGDPLPTISRATDLCVKCWLEREAARNPDDSRELVARWGAAGRVLVTLYRDSRGWIYEGLGIDGRLPASAQSVAVEAIERMLNEGFRKGGRLYTRGDIRRMPQGNGGAS